MTKFHQNGSCTIHFLSPLPKNDKQCHLFRFLVIWKSFNSAVAPCTKHAWSMHFGCTDQVPNQGCIDKGAKAPTPQDFVANIMLWGCDHAKVGVVVQKFHVHGLQPLTSKKLSTPLLIGLYVASLMSCENLLCRRLSQAEPENGPAKEWQKGMPGLL